MKGALALNGWSLFSRPVLLGSFPLLASIGRESLHKTLWHHGESLRRNNTGRDRDMSFESIQPVSPLARQSKSVGESHMRDETGAKMGQRVVFSSIAKALNH